MKLSIPADCNIEQIKNDLGKDAWKALWFIHRITNARSKNNDNYWHTIHSYKIRKYMTTKGGYIIKYLEENKYIRVNHSYMVTVGSEIKGYTKGYNFDFKEKGRHIPCEDKTINRKNIEDNIKWNIDCRAREANTIDEWLLESLKDMGIKYLADNVLKDDPSNDFEGWLKTIRCYESVSQITDGGCDYTICEYGRRHTPITRLSKHLRNFIYFKSMPEERLWEIDIVNSQPLILAMAMLRDNIEQTIDFKNYINVVGEGHLYEDVAKVMGCTREEAKKCSFVTFYGRTPKDGQKLNHLQEYFATMYPTVWNYINKCKEDGYYKLAHKLQRMESEFIFSHVLQTTRKIEPAARILTIHDSVITTKRVGEKIRNIIREEAKKLGIDFISLRTTELKRSSKINEG